jgi:hypothetical protein
MTASGENGFQQVIFAPDPAPTCTSRPYDFHPMYSTSSEHTRVPWAAHSYNVAFSDEIGHFEYCPQVAGTVMGTFTCASGTTASDPGGADADDGTDPLHPNPNCAPASASTRVTISGCTGTDNDFDSPAYKLVWPGSTHNAAHERRFDPQPVRFTSPVFNGSDQYQRVAFEADLAAIEGTQGCSRVTGAGCTNPPLHTDFYPIFTTTSRLAGGTGEDGNGDDRSGCAWQFGGAFLPGTTNTFGGTSATEYATLIPLVYPRATGPVTRFNDYRRVLINNPCPQATGEGGDRH